VFLCGATFAIIPSVVLRSPGAVRDVSIVPAQRGCAKFCREFQDTLAAGGVKCTPIPARSPNVNANAERWVHSIKEECLSKLISFGEASLGRVVSDFLEHFHQERNHQGKDHLLLFPVSAPPGSDRRGTIRCRERLGGLLKFYLRAA
jgi:putative transposase